MGATWRDRVLPVATLVAGCGTVALVVLDGDAVWRAARALVVAGLTAGAVAIERRGGRASRGWTGVAIGVLALDIGAGIGVPYAAKRGVTVETVLGLAVLAAGLVALVVGALTLIAVLRGWRKLFAVPVAYAVLQFATLPVIFAVAATNVPRTAVGKATPHDAGLDYVNARFVTRDGVRLSGWYIPSHNRAAVVVLHGSGSTRADVLPQAAVLARHGYGVLLFDARGHGRSAGRAMDFGWYGDADTSAAVSYVATRPDVDPARIGALGLSMGGEEAIGASAADPRVRAVVAEGATARVAADRAWMARDVVGWISRAESTITYALANGLTDASPPISLRDAVRKFSPRPVLLIAGKPAGELETASYLEDASPNVECWSLSDTAHTAGLRTHPAAWEAHVTAFFDRALAG